MMNACLNWRIFSCNLVFLFFVGASNGQPSNEAPQDLFDAIIAASDGVKNHQVVSGKAVCSLITYTDDKWVRFELTEGFAGVLQMVVHTGKLSNEGLPSVTKSETFKSNQVPSELMALIDDATLALPSSALWETMSSGFGGEVWKLAVTRKSQKIELRLWSPAYILGDAELLKDLSPADKQLLNFCVEIQKHVSALVKN